MVAGNSANGGEVRGPEPAIDVAVLNRDEVWVLVLVVEETR